MSQVQMIAPKEISSGVVIAPSGKQYYLSSRAVVEVEDTDILFFFDSGFVAYPGGGGNGGNTSVIVVQVAVSSDDLLNAAVTPVEIAPAPGPGFKLTLISGLYAFLSGTAYSAGQGGLFYGDPANNIPADTGDGSTFSTLDVGYYTESTYTSTPGQLVFVENMPLNYSTLNGTPYDTGTGAGAISVVYAIVPV